MKTSVNIKMDVEDRDAAKKLFDSLGLDMTTAVNLFVKASLREKAIPFQIAAEQSEAMQERFERELKKDLQASEQDKYSHFSFISLARRLAAFDIPDTLFIFVNSLAFTI